MKRILALISSVALVSSCGGGVPQSKAIRSLVSSSSIVAQHDISILGAGGTSNTNVGIARGVDQYAKIEYHLRLGLSDSEDVSQFKSTGKNLYLHVLPTSEEDTVINNKEREMISKLAPIGKFYRADCKGIGYFVVLGPHNNYSIDQRRESKLRIRKEFKTYGWGKEPTTRVVRNVEGKVLLVSVSHKPIVSAKNTCFYKG